VTHSEDGTITFLSQQTGARAQTDRFKSHRANSNFPEADFWLGIIFVSSR
jgi:hypothetical protein